MALAASHEAFTAFSIDGVPKKLHSQSPNLWSVMRGSAPDGVAPTVTLEFDFAWKDDLMPHWAAVTIQAAWRAHRCRRRHCAAAAALAARCSVVGSSHATASGVRASTRLGARPSVLMVPSSGAGALLGAPRSPALQSLLSSRPVWDMLAASRHGGGGMMAAASAGAVLPPKIAPSRTAATGGDAAGQQGMLAARPVSAASSVPLLSLTGAG